MEQPSLDEQIELKNLESSNKKALTHCRYHNLLSLPHLLEKGTNGKELLMDKVSKASCDFKRKFEHYVETCNG